MSKKNVCHVNENFKASLFEFMIGTIVNYGLLKILSFICALYCQGVCSALCIQHIDWQWAILEII